MRIKILLYFSLVLLGSNAQLTQVETNANSNLAKISILDSSIVVYGSVNYYGVAYDSCSSNLMQSLTPPGLSGNYNSYLNRLSERDAYIISGYSGVTHFQIYKTIDGAQNWSIVFDTTGVFITQLLMFDKFEGLAFSTNNKMFRTVDGGENWVLESNPFNAVFEVHRINDTTIAVGKTNSLSISSDRGHTWGITATMPQNIVEFYFFNQDSICAIALGSGQTYFCSSVNMGNNWSNAILPNNFEAYGMNFKTPNLGYVVGANSATGDASLLKTTNFGQNWEQVDFPISSKFSDIKFLNDSVALICGTNGILLKYNYRDHNLGVKEQNLNHSKIQVYPNPASSEITIQYDLKENYNSLVFEIRDLSGQIIHRQKVNSNIENQIIDLCNLSNGLYISELIADGKSIAIEKFVIEK